MKPEAHKVIQVPHVIRSSVFLYSSTYPLGSHLHSLHGSLHAVHVTPPGRWCQGNWLGRNPHRWRPSPKIPHGAVQRCLSGGNHQVFQQRPPRKPSKMEGDFPDGRGWRKQSRKEKTRKAWLFLGVVKCCKARRRWLSGFNCNRFPHLPTISRPSPGLFWHFDSPRSALQLEPASFAWPWARYSFQPKHNHRVGIHWIQLDPTRSN